MSTVQASTTQTSETPTVHLTGSESDIQQWQKDLARDGYAVVKGAIPRDRALGYASDMHSWLEGFNLGYDRNDKSTRTPAHLPIITEKGMCLQYGLAHEDFVWQVRSEPGVVGAFEKVLNTEDLIVSFDTINFGLTGRTGVKPNSPWPHQDQDPKRPGFRCLQGLVNLLPNGPDDGGLIVAKGGHLLSEQFHKDMAWETPIPAWTPEWYGFTDKGMEYLAEKGCEWVKVCAEPGDLILWDSRAPHYNKSSTTDQDRFAVYTCFMPVSEASQEDLIKKKAAFENYCGTTHWPNCQFTGHNVAMRDGKPDPHNRDVPSKIPQLTERGYRLTGIPYIKV